MSLLIGYVFPWVPSLATFLAKKRHWGLSLAKLLRLEWEREDDEKSKDRFSLARVSNLYQSCRQDG